MESKTGASIRKQLGDVHLPQPWAPQRNVFLRTPLNHSINFHRPCCVPVPMIDVKGKARKRYPYKAMRPPYDKCLSLPQPEHYLKPESPLPQLEDLATASSDHGAVKHLNAATHTIQLSLHRTIGRPGKKGAWLASIPGVQYQWIGKCSLRATGPAMGAQADRRFNDQRLGGVHKPQMLVHKRLEFLQSIQLLFYLHPVFSSPALMDCSHFHHCRDGDGMHQLGSLVKGSQNQTSYCDP